MAKPLPPGHPAVAPVLIVRDAAKALEFYQRAFGAVEVGRLTNPDGRIAHAEFRIGDSLLMIADESPDWGSLAPPSVGGTPVRLHVYLDDVDAAAARAVEAGARIVIPIQDQFYGDRSGRLEDPFGHVWLVSTHLEDVSLEEMQRRADAMQRA